MREALRQAGKRGAGDLGSPGAKRMIRQPSALRTKVARREGGEALVLHDASFVDVWEAMMVIEPEVAALAATRRTLADIDVLVALELVRSAPHLLTDPHAS